jgi:hypothetical protein
MMTYETCDAPKNMANQLTSIILGDDIQDHYLFWQFRFIKKL